MSDIEEIELVETMGEVSLDTGLDLSTVEATADEPTGDGSVVRPRSMTDHKVSTMSDGTVIEESTYIDDGGEELGYVEADEEDEMDELTPEEQEALRLQRADALTRLREYVIDFPEICGDLQLDNLTGKSTEEIVELLNTVRCMVQRGNLKLALVGSYYMAVDIGEKLACKYGMNCKGVSTHIQSDPSIHRSVKQFAIEYSPSQYWDPLLVLAMNTAKTFKAYSTDQDIRQVVAPVAPSVVSEYSDL